MLLLVQVLLQNRLRRTVLQVLMLVLVLRN
jgi:hypothetical protein